jgi:hypothetical protein
MTLIALLAVPYVSLAPMALSAGTAHTIQDDGSSSGGWVSSRGPAGDDAPDGPSTVFPKSVVRARSKEWELKRLEGCGWRLLLTTRCAVRGDVAADDLRAAGVHSDAFIEAIEKQLAGDSEDLRFSVRLFKDRHAFDVYASCAGAKGADSFYDVRNAEAVLHWPAAGGPWRLLMHELAHAYLHRVFRRVEPPWLCEGLAEWFAAYTVGRDYAITPGGPHRAADERLARAQAAGKSLGIRDLLRADREAFAGEEGALFYAAAGSLVRWIGAHQSGTRERAIWELVRGKGLHTLWDLDALEKEWLGSLKK